MFLAAFVVNELRVRNPLVPLSILRVKGVAAADATQLVALAGFLPMFFFLTLYMQTVLGYSPIQTGFAYLPLTGGFIIAASICSQLFARIGTKPVVVLGTMISAGGLYWLSRIPVDGSYLSDILPGLLTVSIGMGGVFTGLTTAANAGVDQDKAGLAAGLLNTGQQLGAALGLAILSAVATAQTKSVLSAGDGLAQAATHGYQRALLVGAFIVLAATARRAPDAQQPRDHRRGRRGRAGARPGGLDTGGAARVRVAPPTSRERRIARVHRTRPQPARAEERTP